MNFKNKLSSSNNSSESPALIGCESFRYIQIFLIIILSVWIVACATRPPVQVGDISNQMQISVSPDGSRLFLYWRDKDKPSQVRARLLWIIGDKTELIRNLELPPDVLSTAYGYSNDEVLATTYKDGIGKLWKINVTTQKKILVTEGDRRLAFPLEQKPGRYVFLEGSGASHFSFWQRLENGKKTQINDYPFRAASNLNILKDGLIVYTPGNRFMVIDGSLPKLPRYVYQGGPFFVDCTQMDEIVCLKSYLGKFEIFYPDTMEIITNNKRCSVPGIWRDVRESVLSRNGKVIVFHAVKNHDTFERGLYLVRFNEETCLVNEISMSGV